MKRSKLLRIISNILFAAGAALGVLAGYLIISTRAALPAGVCPIDNNRPLLYVAIGILVLSFIASLIADKQKKTENTPTDK